MQVRHRVALARSPVVVLPFAALSSGLEAQGLVPYPLAPNPPTGEPVSPFFERWYANADGTYRLSFGSFNLNAREPLHVPWGTHDFGEPAKFDGPQIQHIRSSRERGVFGLTVPVELPESGQRVSWTLSRFRRQ